jgi:hypothetical protein
MSGPGGFFPDWLNNGRQLIGLGWMLAGKIRRIERQNMAVKM